MMSMNRIRMGLLLIHTPRILGLRILNHIDAILIKMMTVMMSMNRILMIVTDPITR